MKKILLFLLATMSAIAATVISGTLVLPQNAASSGTLILSAPTGVSLLPRCGGQGGGAFSAGDVRIAVTAGVLQSSPTITGNDCLSPGNTQYMVRYADANGNLYNASWYIFGATFNVGTQVFVQPPRSWTVVSALPVSCSVGDGIFLTTAMAGQNWYMCTALDTWTQEGGGGASPAGSAGCVQLYATSLTFGCDTLLNWQAAPPGGGNEGGSLIIGSVAAKNAIPAIASLGGINVLGDEDTSTYNLLYINMVGGPASDFTYPVHQFFSFDGTLAAKTALSTGERIGGTVYNGYDGTGFTSGITTQVEVNGSVTTGNVPMDWVVYGGPNSNTEVFRLKGAVTGSASAAICWKTTTTLSYCESVVGAGGTCTCH